MDYICPRCHKKLSKAADANGERVFVCLTAGCTYSATLTEYRARGTIEPLRAEMLSESRWAKQYHDELQEMTAERDALRSLVEAVLFIDGAPGDEWKKAARAALATNRAECDGLEDGG